MLGREGSQEGDGPAGSASPPLPRAPEISVVIPARDEADNIGPLLADVRAALDGRVDYEVVVVDDGSVDATPARLREAVLAFPRLRSVRHRAPSGQSASLWTGVRLARAPWIVTLDGDGQNDPADIPALLDARAARRSDRLLLVTATVSPGTTAGSSGPLRGSPTPFGAGCSATGHPTPAAG